MMLEGVFTGAVFELLQFVARKTAGVSEFQITLYPFFVYLGMLLGFFAPHLFRVRDNVSYVAWTSVPCKLLFIALAFAAGPEWFYLLSALGMTLSKMYLPMNVAVLKSNVPGAVRGSLLGHARSLEMACAIAAASLVGGLLYLDELWYRAVFPAGAAAGLLGVWCFGRIRVRKRGNGALASLPDLLLVLRNDWLFVKYQLLFSVSGIANLIGLPLYVLYIVDVLHANYIQIALCTGVIMNAASMLTLRWWGRVIDRHPNPFWQRAVLSLLWCAHPLMFALADGMGPVYLAYAWYGFLMAGGQMNWMLGPLYFCGGANAAAYTTIHTFFNGIRGMTAPLLAYALYRTVGFETAFCLISLVMLANGIMIYAVYMRVRALPRFAAVSAGAAG